MCTSQSWTDLLGSPADPVFCGKFGDGYAFAVGEPMSGRQGHIETVVEQVLLLQTFGHGQRIVVPVLDYGDIEVAAGQGRDRLVRFLLGSDTDRSG